VFLSKACRGGWGGNREVMLVCLLLGKGEVQGLAKEGYWADRSAIVKRVEGGGGGKFRRGSEVLFEGKGATQKKDYLCCGRSLQKKI